MQKINISVSGNSIIGDKSIKFEVNNGECGEEPKSSDCDTDRERYLKEWLHIQLNILQPRKVEKRNGISLIFLEK